MVYRFQKGSLSLGGSPLPLCWVQPLRSRRELEYSLTLRTIYFNAALRVAIDRFQCIHVLQVLFVSANSTDDLRHIFLFAAQSNSFAWKPLLVVQLTFMEKQETKKNKIQVR